jgi:hypothetical protein
MGQTKRLAILTAAASLMMATGASPLAGAQVTPDPSSTTTTTTNSNATDTTTDDTSQDTTVDPAPEAPAPTDDTSADSTDDTSTDPTDPTGDTTTTQPPGDDASGPDDPTSHGSPGDDSTSHDTPADDSVSHDSPSDDATDNSADDAPGGNASSSGSLADADFVAYIAGSAEVPATSSTAWAWSEFVVTDDGSELQWSARVFGLDNAVAAHLHLAPKGENGPIVVPLEAPEEGSGTNDSADISGTITDDDLAGPLAGMTVGDLVDEIEAGNVYLNIHTSDGEDGASKVPGDYPDGEIRGQLVTWPPQG